MKYSSYSYPCYIREAEYDSLEKIPVYQGCYGARDFGCACMGTCRQIVDYLTREEVDTQNIRKISYPTLKVK